MTLATLLIGKNYPLHLAYYAGSAKRSIYVCAYQIAAPTTRATLHHAELWRRLCAAPLCGLDCRLLYGAPTPSSPGPCLNARAAEKLYAHGWHTAASPGGALLHAKLIIIDESIMYVGSHNLTGAALSHNRELTIATDDAPMIGSALQWWHHQWHTATHPAPKPTRKTRD